MSGPRCSVLSICLLGALLTCGCNDEPAEPGAPADKDETAVSDGNQIDATENHEGEVLRHAVFFSFKDTSGTEDVQSVVDAFKALPAKIDAIKGFQYGTNNSPEGLNDGFTHCFLLTFENEAGRTEYIPHPAHKGEFADVLRPHMDKVFVIDYWGRPYEPLQQELKHCVFFKFRKDAAADDIRRVEQEFAALPSKIESIKAFEWGINNSPEKNDHGFTHCFMVTFASEAGRAEYLPHPDHKAFVEVLKPVLDQVRVLDFTDGIVTASAAKTDEP